MTFTPSAILAYANKLPPAQRAVLSITVPIHTVNPLNNRRHWRTVWARGQREKQTTAIFLHGKKLPPLPAIVTLTRIGKRKMDTDGLAASFKATRDAIAINYGVDDGDARYEWRYAQEIGKEYGVRIEITNHDEARP